MKTKEVIVHPLTLLKAFPSEYDDKIIMCVIQQTVDTISTYTRDSLADSIFDLSEFGDEQTYRNSVKRTCLMPAPSTYKDKEGNVKKMTAAVIRKRLDQLIKLKGDKCRIWVYRGLEPLINSNQKTAIEEGKITEEDVAFKQLVMSAEQELIPYVRDGKKYPQYKAYFLSTEGREDEDYRDSQDPYMPLLHLVGDEEVEVDDSEEDDVFSWDD